MTLSKYSKNDLGFEQDKLARYIADQVFLRASGRGIPVCTQNYPRDVYFIGNLRPRPSDEADPFIMGRSNELINKLAPVAFGAEFRLIPEGGQGRMIVRLALEWNCYYRVIPTFEEQYAHQFQPDDNNNNTPDDGQLTPENSDAETDDNRAPADSSPDVNDSPSDRRNRRKGKTDTLFIKFKQIACQAEGEIQIQPTKALDGVEWDINSGQLERAIADEIERARQIVIADPDTLKTNGDLEDNIRIPDTALSNQDQYATHIRTLLTPIIPTWSWGVDVTVRDAVELRASGEKLLSIEFTNASAIDEKSKNLEQYCRQLCGKIVNRASSDTAKLS